MTTFRTDGRVLGVERLTVTFRTGRREVTALQDVDLTLAAGEFLAVVGPSGCGKSTLLRALAGLLLASAVVDRSSTITVPRDASGRPDVVWMPQQNCLLPWRRAMANAALGARVAGVPRAEAVHRASEMFERFGLAGFERSWPHELSGGMRQRLALLRTTLTGRSVLLLDEPFGALDAITRRSMNQWLADLRRSHDGALPSTVVLVTHDVDEAVTLADRVIVMSSRPGRIVDEIVVATEQSPRERVLAALSVE
ncbi:ABC-type nitrate/sulfonate/bicarbonate transport system, ATPase component [Sanguibacter gelidistatuariae]|uniref:ABC-type nitrate/sulfonate/bicarbonate transport system, ATPase component n=1 Tax=Sanguibacter gelidistatuariae TaxID=1814289 RepID=A0A1G6P4L2_9MICO|nr:ATP-binding cassette domain-containing protein [Sanguibacter gelidistatuariae]SDC74436.1 ABC-type nitrate/sulfonate/bicarbonate transport system, ATPase component [Sanguibacter gelidistatuariae]